MADLGSAATDRSGTPAVCLYLWPQWLSATTPLGRVIPVPVTYGLWSLPGPLEASDSLGVSAAPRLGLRAGHSPRVRGTVGIAPHPVAVSPWLLDSDSRWVRYRIRLQFHESRGLDLGGTQGSDHPSLGPACFFSLISMDPKLHLLWLGCPQTPGQSAVWSRHGQGPAVVSCTLAVG